MALQADKIAPCDPKDEEIRNRRHIFPLIRRSAWLLASAAVAASLLAACSGGASNHSALPARISPPMSLGAAARSGTATLPASILFVSRGIAIDGIAADPRHLVWETGPFEDEGTPTLLHQRPLAGGPIRTLATAVVPNLGVASTARWVVYAVTRGTTSSLMAVHHDGSGAHRIANGLVAPLAQRGALVAWAEERAGIQRVVVSDLDANRTWVAAAMPRCVRGRCYRIDAVTLSDSGVVFDRGAIGPQPSLVVRRAFTAARPGQRETYRRPAAVPGRIVLRGSLSLGRAWLVPVGLRPDGAAAGDRRRRIPSGRCLRAGSLAAARRRPLPARAGRPGRRQSAHHRRCRPRRWTGWRVTSRTCVSNRTALPWRATTF